MDQLRALESGALAYTLVSDEVGVGGKKIVRIAYPRCSAWQQVATLLKAFKEYQTQQFNTIVIQGVTSEDNSIYAYNNGQLWFDRNVRLGSQLINRYQIETGTGLESDSVRIVLAEE
jgi:coenzyme F420-reducing hydrogenase delta subunit